MARALISFRVIDQEGDAEPNVSVLILNEDGSPFGQVIYTAASGGSVLPNPLVTDATGLAQGYVPTPQRALARTTVDGVTRETVFDITPDPADIALGGRYFDVTSYGATGDGTTNDATAIDAAVVACQTAGGGVVYFPRGRYRYSGAGIVNNPSLGVNQPLLLRGDGESASQLIFASVSNPEAIKLSSANAIGTFVCQGSGVEHLYIETPTSKDAIVITNVEQWRVRHVSSAQSRTFLKVANTRGGRAEHLYIYNFNEHGISVNEGLTGVNLDTSLFSDIWITGTNTPTGWGFSMMMGAAPDGNEGTYLSRVLVNNGLGGIRIGSTSGVNTTEMFVFLENCVADSANFTEAPFQVKNGKFVYFENCWAYCTLAGKAAVELDRVSYASWRGGQATNGHGTPAGGGSIFDLKNGCANMVIKPSHMLAAPGGTGVTALNSSAGTAPVAVSFESGYQENVGGMIAAGKLLSVSDTQRAMSAVHVYTSAESLMTEFALLDEGLVHGRFFRLNVATGDLETLNSAHSAVIATLTDSGDIGRRRRVARGTALTSGAFALSAGWGTGALVDQVQGTDDHFTFRVRAGSASFSASPNVVITFADGTWTNTPTVSVNRQGGNQHGVNHEVTVSATQITISVNLTPAASEVYVFGVVVTGR